MDILNEALNLEIPLPPQVPDSVAQVLLFLINGSTRSLAYIG